MHGPCWGRVNVTGNEMTVKKWSGQAKTRLARWLATAMYFIESVDSICRILHLQVFLWPTRLLVAWKDIVKVPTRKSPNGQNLFLQMGYFKIAWIYHNIFHSDQSKTPLHFHNSKVSQDAWNHSLKIYGFNCAIFTFHMHAQKCLYNN